MNEYEWAVGRHLLHDRSWDFISHFDDDEEGARRSFRNTNSAYPADRALLRRKVLPEPKWEEVIE